MITACASGMVTRISRREIRSASAPPHSMVTSDPTRPAAAITPAPNTDPVLKTTKSGNAIAETLEPTRENAVPLHQHK